MQANRVSFCPLGSNRVNDDTNPPSLSDLIMISDKNASSKDLFKRLRKIAKDDEIVVAIFRGVFSKNSQMREAANRLIDNFFAFINICVDSNLLLSRNLANDLTMRGEYLPNRCYEARRLCPTDPIQKNWDPQNMQKFNELYQSVYFDDRCMARHLAYLFLCYHKNEVQESFQKIANEMIHNYDIQNRIDGMKYLEILKRHGSEIGEENLSRAIELATKWYYGVDTHLSKVAYDFLGWVFEKGPDREIRSFIPMIRIGCDSDKYKTSLCHLLNKIFKNKQITEDTRSYIFTLRDRLDDFDMIKASQEDLNDLFHQTIPLFPNLNEMKV